MAKLGISFIVVCALAGALFFVWQSELDLKVQQADLSAKMYPLGKVVYAVTNIPAGTRIAARDVEERQLELRKFPQAAIQNSYTVVGFMAGREIKRGQVISSLDLVSYDRKTNLSNDQVRR